VKNPQNFSIEPYGELFKPQSLAKMVKNGKFSTLLKANRSNLDNESV